MIDEAVKLRSRVRELSCLVSNQEEELKFLRSQISSLDRTIQDLAMSAQSQGLVSLLRKMGLPIQCPHCGRKVSEEKKPQRRIRKAISNGLDLNDD